MGKRTRNWDLWLRLPAKYNSDSKFKNGPFIVSVSLLLGSLNGSLLIPKKISVPLGKRGNGHYSQGHGSSQGAFL